MIIGIVGTNAQQRLQSPDEFLGQPLGEQFTPHHVLVNYFEQVAANSSFVKLYQYGETPQSRPQFIAIITSKENQERLEEIRLNNLRLAGLADGTPDMKNPVAIVWLSYTVHGNEPSGAECSMQVLYDLVEPGNSATKEWLKNTVVIIDPVQNPDGYDRYTHWIRDVSHRIPNPNLDSREHVEPWPTGRVNHYLFDLNRDWVWASQLESQNRLKAYHEWMPHVHPDLHEQYIDNPYYFAPAAEPYHKYITPWQREFQVEIGKNNAKYFDQNGWLYFTREVFDLFYPSYGDTYPTFNGAIGMTYEQAGHSRGGRSALMSNGDTLTLADRIEHHRTASLATIEVSSKNAGRLVQNFRNYFDQSISTPPGVFKTFIIKNKKEDEAKIAALCALLDQHKIRYGRLSNGVSRHLTYSYESGKDEAVDIDEQDLIISSYQPKSILAQVLLEPEAQLADSLTYDITGWSLPYAFGLKAYASKQRLNPSKPFVFYKNAAVPWQKQGEPYAAIIPWNSLSSAAFLSAVLQKRVQARFASLGFSRGGKKFAPGTLIITRADNRTHDQWSSVVAEAAHQYNLELTWAESGYMDEGNDFGSYKMQLVTAPQIAVVYGNGVDNNAYGFVWHYLEQNINYPFAAIDIEQMKNMDLSAYNVLILTEGYYTLNDDVTGKLSQWVSKGGKLLLIGSANAQFAGKADFGLKKPEEAKKDSTDEPQRREYQAVERDQISESTPGAIIKIKTDASHPLAFGLGDHYFYLKSSGRYYSLLEGGGWNVGYIDSEIFKSGFIGAKLIEKLKNTLAFGVERKGAGQVVYFVDDPLFRSFWYSGKLLFSNALFLN